MAWFVYIVLCKDGSYYTGATDDPLRRFAEHAASEGAKYTRDIGVERLLWTELHPTKSSAIIREAQIKRWTRRKKEALINSDLVLLKAL